MIDKLLTVPRYWLILDFQLMNELIITLYDSSHSKEEKLCEMRETKLTDFEIQEGEISKLRKKKISEHTHHTR